MWLCLVALCLGLGGSDAAGPERARRENPEQFMNVSQRIRFHGYPSEEYEVLTEDGYFLSMNRIPHGREAAGNRDAGYDVWLGNNRGNNWSRRHLNLSTDQEEFWDFSFHEMAMYDLPAMVNFILQKTGHQKLYYVGFSQGSTLGFIAFSALPEMAEKIKTFFVLGPAYTFRNSKGPLASIFFLPDKLLKVIFGTKEGCLLGRKQRAALAKACSRRLLSRLCADLLFLVGGFDRKNLNASRTDVYISHFPDYTSVKDIIHWGQTAKTGEFKQFDYGKKKNQEKYHQPSPPFYRIEDMTVPTALFSGGQDWVTPTKEIQRLLPRIPNLIHHEHFPDWNHVDHIWGLDASLRMYRKIIGFMENSQ